MKSKMELYMTGQARDYIHEMAEGKTLAIFGSRVLNDNEEVKRIIEEEIEEKNITEIVTAGEIGGVSEIGRKIAKRRSLCLRLFYPNRKRFATGCYSIRSILIVYHSDEILMVWDGESKGTKGEIEMCGKMKLDYHLIVVRNEKEKIFHGMLGDDILDNVKIEERL